MGPPALVKGAGTGAALWMERRASHWERPQAAGHRSHRHLLRALWGRLCGTSGRGRPGPLNSLSKSLEASISWPAIPDNNTHPSSVCVLGGVPISKHVVSSTTVVTLASPWAGGEQGLGRRRSRLPGGREAHSVSACVSTCACTRVCANTSGRPVVGSSGREALRAARAGRTLGWWELGNLDHITQGAGPGGDGAAVRSPLGTGTQRTRGLGKSLLETTRQIYHGH